MKCGKKLNDNKSLLEEKHQQMGGRKEDREIIKKNHPNWFRSSKSTCFLTLTLPLFSQLSF